MKPDLSTAPGLALEWHPNKTATVWVVKLRPDVTFHNGKSFTADDVIYTLRSMGDAKHVGHFAVTNIKLGELKKIDKLTVQHPAQGPDARLYDQFVNGNTVVIQNGETELPEAGRDRARSCSVPFTPGERSHCVREPELLGVRASRTSTRGRTSRSTIRTRG